MKLNFKEITYKSQDWELAVRIREKILREPLGNKFTSKELEEEKDHIQIAGFLDAELVATAVLVPEGVQMKMQRVVVLENLRNMNIGTKMLDFCEKIASDRNFKLMYCHARDTAINFYFKNHYEKEGDYFDEDGIPHMKMKKTL
jgi:predicted GNAT family N-acyltransferase